MGACYGWCAPAILTEFRGLLGVFVTCYEYKWYAFFDFTSELLLGVLEILGRWELMRVELGDDGAEKVERGW